MDEIRLWMKTGVLISLRFCFALSGLDERNRDISSVVESLSTSRFLKTASVMFTIEQINDIHDRLGSAKTLAEYVRALKALGVERYDSYLADGHSEYFGQGGHTVVSPPVHEVLPVAATGQRETFLQHLDRHERRETTYLEMSRGLAQSGIEKWTVDTGRMTMTFYDKAGTEMLFEQIS